MSEHMIDTAIKEIPYGIANYELIRQESYYYVDKTPYLQNWPGLARKLSFGLINVCGDELFSRVDISFYLW